MHSGHLRKGKEAVVYRVRDLIGKSVISAQSGDRIGSIREALVDEHDIRIVAFVIGRGALDGDHVLPYDDVQTFGGATVLARSGAGIMAPREWHRSGVSATRLSRLRGRPIVTKGGRRLGEFNDLIVNERSGACAAMEVVASTLGGLRQRRSLVDSNHGMRIGPHVVIVPDDFASDDVGRGEDRMPADQATDGWTQERKRE
jgi:uncharacterized protein YrrD